MPMRSPKQSSSLSTGPHAHPPIPAWLSDTSLPLPELIVFDLDYTLWPFWVDTHVTSPLRPNASHTAATDRVGEDYSFYPDVPAMLQALSQRHVKLAVASRTSAPTLARQLLRMLCLAPLAGDDAQKRKKAIDVFDAGLEIYPSSKLRHFEALQKRSGIVYEDMLFFDDESRNRETEQLGVTMRLVRDGMTWDELAKGVNEWRLRRETRSDR